MNSQAIYFNPTYLKRHSEKTEFQKLMSESLTLTKNLTPSPIKEVVNSFWKVWTAEV